MNKKEENEKINTIVSPFQGMLDYDMINQQLLATNNSDIGEISAKTIKNIAKWALNGSSVEEIANNLELSKKQFNTLCTLCPAIVYVMQNSRAMAEIVLVGTLYQRALGGRIKKQQALKVKDYDDNGKVIGEHYEKVWLEEELPPEPSLLKYLAEKRLSEKFGENIVDEDAETKKLVMSLSNEQLEQLEKELSNGKK